MPTNRVETSLTAEHCGIGGAASDNASLDRIDNNLGYIKGNVRYVALIVNYARNSWGDNAVRGFARAVVENEDKNKLIVYGAEKRFDGG